MSAIKIGPADLLTLINAAIEAGAGPGHTLVVTDADGNQRLVTLGETTTAPGRKMLVAVAVEPS